MKKPKLTKNGENIVKMLKSTIPEDAAKWLDVILDDLAETVDQRAVREYDFKTESGEYISNACYVSTPRVGEFYELADGTEYEVMKVKHVADYNYRAGEIIVRYVGKNEITKYED